LPGRGVYRGKERRGGEERHFPQTTIYRYTTETKLCVCGVLRTGINLNDYYKSTEWDLLGVKAKKNHKHYPCCAEPYPDIKFNITIRRKTLFYTVGLRSCLYSVSVYFGAAQYEFIVVNGKSTNSAFYKVL